MQGRHPAQVVTQLAQDLAALQARYPVPAPQTDLRPIFVLSAGWRSGSTALQRLLMSQGQAIIWGEPYEAEGVVQGLAESLRAVAGMPEKKNSFVESLMPTEELAHQWVPTFGPPVADLVEAHRALFLRLFGARPEYASQRWGLKTVRLEPDYGAYFKLLFPSCALLYLIRDPYKALSSFHGSRFLKRAPDSYVTTAEDFGKHWVSCARRVNEMVRETEGLLVRYEDLGNPDTISTISAVTGLEINSAVLGTKVGSTATPYNSLPARTRRTFESLVGKVARSFGYTAPNREL